jgi:hypothetical protein
MDVVLSSDANHSPVAGASQLRYRGGAHQPGSPDSGVDHDLSSRSIGDASDTSDCGERDTSSVLQRSAEKLRALYSSGVVKSSEAKGSRGDTALAVLVAVIMLSGCAFTLLMMTRGLAVKSASSEAHKVALYAERNGKYASMAFAAAGAKPDVVAATADPPKTEEVPVKDEDDPFRFRKPYF